MLGNKEINARMLKIYIMHSLLWNGFETCQEQTLTVLTDFIIHFIKKLGLESKNIATLAGHSNVTIFDLLLLLNQYNYKLSDEISDFIKNNKKNLGHRVSFLDELFDLIKSEKKDIKISQVDQNSSSNIIKKKLENPLKRKLAEVLNEDKNKKLPKEFPSFYPNFPEEFCYQESKSNELISFEEAEIKKIKSMQRRQITSEMSKMLEPAEVIEKKEEIQENEEFPLENPFNIPLKKIKTLNVNDITKSQLF